MTAVVSRPEPTDCDLLSSPRQMLREHIFRKQLAQGRSLDAGSPAN